MIMTTHKAGIRLTDKQSGTTSEHVLEFTPTEWEQLQAYLREVKALESTRFVQQGSGVHLNLKWAEHVGISWSVQMPPADDLLAFLHRLRPLILQREPTSFIRVRNLMKRTLKGAADPLLEFVFDLFQGRQMQKQIVMQSNDQIMNSEEMLHTWLNAHEYHRDRDKQEFLEALHKILPLEWSRGIFVSLLVDKAKAILALATLVELVLGERQTITVNL